MIRVDNLTVALGPQHRILHQVSLDLTQGQIHAIIGPNGSGKTSLLKSMVGLYKSEKGCRIEINGGDVSLLPPTERAALVSYVESQHVSPFAFSVKDTISWGRFSRHGGAPHKSDLDAAKKAAEMLDIAALLDKPVTALSTGERKKTFLAQSLASGAKVFIWDEPIASLDPKAAIQLLELTKKLSAAENSTFVMSFHDLGLAVRYADTIGVLDNGHLKWHGPTTAPDSLIAIENVFGIKAHHDGLGFKLLT